MALVVRFDQPMEVSQLEKLFSDYGKCKVLMDPQQLHARVKFCSSRPFIDAARAKFYVIERNAIAMQVQWARATEQSLVPPKWWTTQHGDNMTEGLAQEGQASADPGSSLQAHEHLNATSTALFPGSAFGDRDQICPHGSTRTSAPCVQCFRSLLEGTNDIHIRVHETVKLFRKYREQLVMESFRTRGRPRRKAALVLARGYIVTNELALNQKKRYGSVPGVRIGQKFKHRVELSIIGLHSNFRSGIDTMVEDEDGKDRVAISVVYSGAYRDDMFHEDVDVVEYTGQGGMKGGALTANQQMNWQNKAMELSARKGYPIRLILGTGSPTDMTYTYAGLYVIFKEEYVRGLNSDYYVWKFHMRRSPSHT